LMETIGLDGEEHTATRVNVLRSLDKMDKFPRDQIELLLGTKGRKDESGDITKGAGLDETQIDMVFRFLDHAEKIANVYFPEAFERRHLPDVETPYKHVREGLQFLGENQAINDALLELETIHRLTSSADYGSDRIRIDPSVIRGLEYYTGPVFEAEVTFDVKNDKGQVVQFGSVGGGGRYDGLVARFKGVEIPATGMSIGVSRLYTAMQMLEQTDKPAPGPVLVLVMDKERLGDYQKMAYDLRSADIRCEMYVGSSGMKAQMKYADKRGAPCVVIAGSDEFDAGEVTIKDLVKGAQMSKEIDDNKSWREGRPAQFSVKRIELVEAVRCVLERHES